MLRMAARVQACISILRPEQFRAAQACGASGLPSILLASTAFAAPSQEWFKACFASSADGSGRMQAAVEILGKRKGEQMAMLVHHSRNSVQKQWEETLVLALSGMGRILRAHLPVLITITGFSQVPLVMPLAWHCPTFCA